MNFGIKYTGLKWCFRFSIPNSVTENQIVILGLLFALVYLCLLFQTVLLPDEAD